MKKILNVAVIVAMIFAWISVFVIPTSAQTKNTDYYAMKYGSLDTIVPVSCSYEKPILRDRFDCNGNKLSNQKVVAWETASCSTIAFVRISDQWLRDKGYGPIAKEVAPPTPGFWEKYGNDFPWWLIGLLLAVALIIWIVKTVKGDYDSKAPALAPPAPVNPPTPTIIDKADALGKVITAMKTNGVATGEVNLANDVVGKFTFISEKGNKPTNQENPNQPDTSAHQMD